MPPPAGATASRDPATSTATAPLPSATSEALSTSTSALEIQQAYDRYSSNYDDLDGGVAAEALGFPQLRQRLLEQAHGSVLEVAVGTGLNLQYYRWQDQGQGQAATSTVEVSAAAPGGASASQGPAAAAGVSSLTAVDLSGGMLAQAARRVAADGALDGRPISFQQADVVSLPYQDNSFDSVVDTFSLCVFPDPQAAVNELARVVRPASAGGSLLLLEHARSPNPLLAAYQDATAGPVAALGKGCVWNQDVERMLRTAGLQVVYTERAAAGTVELIRAVKP